MQKRPPQAPPQKLLNWLAVRSAPKDSRNARSPHPPGLRDFLGGHTGPPLPFVCCYSCVPGKDLQIPLYPPLEKGERRGRTAEGVSKVFMNPRSCHDFLHPFPLPVGEGTLTAAPHAPISLWERVGVRARNVSGGLNLRQPQPCAPTKCLPLSDRSCHRIVEYQE